MAFTNETATGWQTVTFASPVPVTAGMTYVVSYTAPNGHYAVLADAFELSGRGGRPAVGPAAASARPTRASTRNAGQRSRPHGGRNSNYYVDVLFNASGAPDPVPTIAVTGRQPAPGATGVPTGTTVTVGLSAPVDPGSSLSVSQGSAPVAGTVVASNGGQTLTFTPSAALAPGALTTVNLAGVTSIDGIDLAPESWSFTTAAVGPVGDRPAGFWWRRGQALGQPVRQPEAAGGAPGRERESRWACSSPLPRAALSRHSATSRSAAAPLRDR